MIIGLRKKSLRQWIDERVDGIQMMMLSQAAEVLHGQLIGADVLFTSVSKDTRSLQRGDLYVAIKGGQFDGHAFIEQARQAGAAGALVQKAQLQTMQASELSQVCVDDTLLALGQLAANWRQQFNGKLIGLTGSNGKTTVKEMCRHVLQTVVGESAVLATQGNLNNDIGMPMTLLELRQQHQYAVIEMGANHVGEIEYLSTIARPDIAILNNAGAAHLEGFGGIENVAQAKAEIFNGLDERGTAVVNLDDDFAPMWLELCANKNTITFSYSQMQADVYAENNQNGLVVHHNAEQAILNLNVPGKHNVMNALAAIAALLAAGLQLEPISEALATFKNISGRLNQITLENGARIIDDSYNANPTSVKAGVDVLVGQSDKSILVLGDMAELGDDVETLHAQVGRYAKTAGVKRLYATGAACNAAVHAFGDDAKWFQDKTALVAALSHDLTQDTVVLVKGSRAMRMEEVVTALDAKNNNRKQGA